MDRNSIIGLLLIGAVLIGFNLWNAPSEEEIAEQKRRDDSLRAKREAQVDSTETAQIVNDSLTQDSTAIALDSLMLDSLAGDSAAIDSLKAMQIAQQEETKKPEKPEVQLGIFQGRDQGEEQYYTIENDLIKAVVSNKGGRIVSVQLKEYSTYDGEDLLLQIEDSSSFGLEFYQSKNLVTQTDSLFFEPLGESFTISGEDTKQLAMRLYSSESRDQYIEYLYTVSGDDYMIDFDIRFVGLRSIIRENNKSIPLIWSIDSPVKEKGIDNERNNTTVFFQYKDDDADYVSEMSYEKISLDAPVTWVSFKQQFFSAVAISEKGFDNRNAYVETQEIISSNFVKRLNAGIGIPLEETDDAVFQMQFYYGPNHYQTLLAYDIGLQDQINLGWGIFGWVNEFLVIPIFNILDGLGFLNYGIIILLLTIIIKLILFPLTYRNYYSSAKMRVLKPEVDEITKQMKDEDPLKKQQATMALYKKAGVNPMAGCVPMLLQMPILYAMFRFFPSSIELRGQSFLWADDLSTYDSIYTFPGGFEIPFYGDHISLFTLLMALSTFFYTRYNMQMSGTGSQMPQMKVMVYFMPVMLLFFFNSYSAGLSYYYLAANVISMLQQFVIKNYFINEEAIRQKIADNKKRPAKKKSRFQKSLENMQKAQQERMKQQQQAKGGKRKK